MRSKITHLPDNVRAELEEQLLVSRTSTYAELAEWLTELGYPIGKSAIGLFAKALGVKRLTLVEQLPADVRAGLDHRLKVNRYTNYQVISAWLGSIGHPIGKSAIGEYAKSLMARNGIKPGSETRFAGRACRDWRTLPASLQVDLAKRIVQGGWNKPKAHALWLQESGHPIGVAAVKAFVADLTTALAVQRCQAVLRAAQPGCTAAGDALPCPGHLLR
ncbi:phage protein Gp27 family protein [Stenotrophomonas maltophilia]|uniref:phage protein Gp27 family protein n=1 Tax=Stenotrophomonas maltophilia TaxID=40324 RepID=UPI0013DACAA9|nr:phage protein Gp27 family protein [Stenotrophomonas maltophilia]